MNIKYLRNKKGLTQEELAKAIGAAQPTVACWETGRASPTSDKLPDIAAALGCTIDELYGKEG